MNTVLESGPPFTPLPSPQPWKPPSHFIVEMEYWNRRHFKVTGSGDDLEDIVARMLALIPAPKEGEDD